MDPVAITTSVETLDELWLYCYRGCMLVRASRTKETARFFVKIWFPINGTQQYGIESPKIHKNSVSLWVVNRTLGFGASQ